MGIIPAYRHQGIGTHLSTLLIGAAKQHSQAISLSVRGEIPAVRLYKRFVFETIARTDMVNRAGGRSFTMQLAFRWTATAR